jgi:hypothetical protein
MTVLKFKRYNVVDDIIDTLRDDADEVIEALVVGKKQSGARFSFMTLTDNIPELIGYLEAIKTELALELIEQAEQSEE